jgi:hypothetical protein
MVARIGAGPGGYPWILADTRNWVLRLGTSRGEDEKYFSSLPCLLEGVLAHLLRRRLGQGGVIEGVELLIREHRASLEYAKELGQRLAAALERPAGRGQWPQAV